MYNALAYNYYYLGEEDESHYYWDKLKQISKSGNWTCSLGN